MVERIENYNKKVENSDDKILSLIDLVKVDPLKISIDVEDVMNDCFEGISKFVAVDVGKMVHAIPVPIGDMKVSNKTIGAVPIFTDVQERDPLDVLDIDSTTFANAYAFYSNIIVPDFDQEKEFNIYFHDYTYRDLYKMSRLVAYLLGWVSVKGNSETILSDGKIIKETDKKIIEGNTNALNCAIRESGIIKCISDCKDFHILKAISWWQTNHSVGQGAFSNVWVKALSIKGITVDDKKSSSALYSGFYNIFHFSSVRNILGSISDLGIKVLSVPDMPCASRVALDAFIGLRMGSYPAGCASLAFIGAIIKSFIAGHFHHMVSNRDIINRYINILAGYRVDPACFHIGASYLGKEPRTLPSETMIEIGIPMFQYAEVFMPNASIMKSSFKDKLRVQVPDSGFANYLAAYVKNKGTIRGLGNIIMKISGGDYGGILSKMPNEESKEQKDIELRAALIRELETMIVNDDKALIAALENAGVEKDEN